MTHRTEHIYANLVRTLNHLHEASESKNEPVVPATPQVSAAVPAVKPPPAPVAAPAPPQPVTQVVQPPVAQLVQTEGLSYMEAIRVAQGGIRVRRLGWAEGIYVFVEDGTRIMKCTEGGHLPNNAIIGKFTPVVNDVLATDWVLLTQQNCTFQAAIEAMEGGQTARRPSWAAFVQIRDGKFTSLDDLQQECTMRYEDICSSDWEIM